MIEREVELFSLYDVGWGDALPVSLVYFEGGQIDLHTQTGPGIDARIDLAEKILAERGLCLVSKEPALIGPSGAYFPVRVVAKNA